MYDKVSSLGWLKSAQLRITVNEKLCSRESFKTTLPGMFTQCEANSSSPQIPEYYPKVRESWNCVFHGWENPSTSLLFWPRDLHKNRWFGKSFNVNSRFFVQIPYACGPSSVLIKFRIRSHFESCKRLQFQVSSLDDGEWACCLFADDFGYTKSLVSVNDCFLFIQTLFFI